MGGCHVHSWQVCKRTRWWARTWVIVTIISMTRTMLGTPMMIPTWFPVIKTFRRSTRHRWCCLTLGIISALIITFNIHKRFTWFLWHCCSRRWCIVSIGRNFGLWWWWWCWQTTDQIFHYFRWFGWQCWRLNNLQFVVGNFSRSRLGTRIWLRASIRLQWCRDNDFGCFSSFRLRNSSQFQGFSMKPSGVLWVVTV